MAQSCNWVFTLNNPDAPLVPPDDCKFLVYQKECVSTPHFQGYAVFAKNKRLAAVKKWLPSAHWEIRRGTHEQAIAYSTKEDSRVEGPWEHGDSRQHAGSRSDITAVRDAIFAGASKRQILDDFPEVAAKYPRFVADCVSAAAQDATEKVLDISPKVWQKYVLDLVEGPVDPRAIYWFYDSEGNTGKTYLSRHLVDACGAFYCRGGKAVDIAYAFNGASVAIFDYVRDHKDYVSYGTIEALKDGMVFSTKYESQLKRFNSPHVFVFANFLADSSMFSADRLRVFQIRADGSYLALNAVSAL